MARVPEILAAAAILLPGCASADTPRPTNGPVVQEVIATATAIPCVPKEFAERMGVPTPISIGGGAASAEIVRLTNRLYRCDETLSDVEKDALRALNANNPLLATPDPAKQIVPQPANTPAPAPELVLPPKPENFLPEYAVYSGKMRKEGEPLANDTVTIAHLPGYDNQVYVFAAGGNTFGGFLFKIDDPNTPDLNGSMGRAKINFKLEGQKIVGTVTNLLSTPSWSFEITRTGTGKQALIESGKKSWATTKLNNPSLWSGVPDETILNAGFERAYGSNGNRTKINLP